MSKIIGSSLRKTPAAWLSGAGRQSCR